MSLTEQFTFEAAIVSVDKFSTPHYLERTHKEDPLPNQDYAALNPELGVFIGDGMGGHNNGEEASEFVVEATLKWIRELGISELESNDAANAIRYEIMPRVDAEFATHKRIHNLDPMCGTTLGGLAIAHNDLIAVGVGDTMVYKISQTPSGKPTILQQLTTEQASGHYLTNLLAGKGRNSSDHHILRDCVVPVGIERGDRYFILSDGVLGDAVQQRIPPDKLLEWITSSDDAQTLVDSIVNLPRRLFQENLTVPVPQNSGKKVPYQPKDDDLSAAVLLIK